LSTDKQHRRISKRIELTKAILQTKGVAVTEIASKGGMLKQMMTAMYLGDLMSYFLALRYETDPTPVKLIEQFKNDLGPFLI
jgi:glucose/mannose-6-phosphate isomerase